MLLVFRSISQPFESSPSQLSQSAQGRGRRGAAGLGRAATARRSHVGLALRACMLRHVVQACQWQRGCGQPQPLIHTFVAREGALPRRHFTIRDGMGQRRTRLTRATCAREGARRRTHRLQTGSLLGWYRCVRNAALASRAGVCAQCSTVFTVVSQVPSPLQSAVSETGRGEGGRERRQDCR